MMILPDRTVLMGILNVTPDSFYDKGKFFSEKNALEHAKMMIENGADIIDIGGESTHPVSKPVSIKEEISRVVPILKKLKNFCNQISIDTYKPQVAEICIQEGATIINDITGLRDIKMVEIAAKYKVPVVIMHMKGTPQTMQKNVNYKNIITEIKIFFEKRIKLAEEYGINDIILDPGISFGKDLEHNIDILKNLKKFKVFNRPILIGTSRKGFLSKIVGLPIDSRLEATLATVVISIMNGAKIIRVHDVKECKIVSQITDKFVYG